MPARLRVLTTSALLLTIACGPAHTHIERITTLVATPVDAFPHLADLRKFVVWSPWSKLDPDAAVDFSDPSTGEGAWYRWKGNDDIGSGKMTIIEAQPDQVVRHRIEFFEPWEGVSESSLSLRAEADAVTVTWQFDQDNEGLGRLMMGFIDMEAMIGADYERGLKNLGEEVARSVTAREAAAAPPAPAPAPDSEPVQPQ